MEVNMTQKFYTMHEFEGRGFRNYEDIPEEMLDYLPENMDQDDDSDDNF